VEEVGSAAWYGGSAHRENVEKRKVHFLLLLQMEPECVIWLGCTLWLVKLWFATRVAQIDLVMVAFMS